MNLGLPSTGKPRLFVRVGLAPTETLTAMTNVTEHGRSHATAVVYRVSLCCSCNHVLSVLAVIELLVIQLLRHRLKFKSSALHTGANSKQSHRFWKQGSDMLVKQQGGS
jgi:hypothetical protein